MEARKGRRKRGLVVSKTSLAGTSLGVCVSKLNQLREVVSSSLSAEMIGQLFRVLLVGPNQGLKVLRPVGSLRVAARQLLSEVGKRGSEQGGPKE